MSHNIINPIIAVIVILPFALWHDFTTFQWLVCLYLFWNVLNAHAILNRLDKIIEEMDKS
jgi:hypothetical protein